MAQNFGVVVAVVVVALCLSSLLGVAYSQEKLSVHGNVYCDTCRAAFETPVSYPLPGSLVRLSCRNRTTSAVKFASFAITDLHGNYKISVEGDHEDELCEIALVKSGDPSCDQFLKDHIVDTDRVALTNNNGIAHGQAIRYANPLFFAKKNALPECPDVLRKMGVLPAEILF